MALEPLGSKSNDMTKPKHILLVIGGGIAAYKTSELIRLIKKSGMTVRCVLTESGAQFVTPMTLAALSENEVHTTLWSLKDEAEMGHIQLSREADLLVICPATANLLAKMAGGVADDLATTLLLATDAGHGGPRNECEDVAACRHPAQYKAAQGRWHLRHASG